MVHTPLAVFASEVIYPFGLDFGVEHRLMSQPVDRMIEIEIIFLNHSSSSFGVSL